VGASSTDKTEILIAALEGLSEWVLVLDPDGMVVWSNRAFNEFMGGGECAENPRHLRELCPTFANELIAEYHDIAVTGEPCVTSLQSIQGKNGETRVIRFTVTPHYDSSGEITRVLIYGLDITDLAAMEQFKKDAYAQIEKNIEQFAILGDHLRNPLTAIIGLSDLLDDKTTGARIHSLATEIDGIITRIDRGWIESEKVRNIIKKYYDIGATGTRELVARAIHAQYLENEKLAGETPETNSSMRPWNELPNRLKDSNIRQAENIWKMLHKIHCTIALSSETREPLFEFSDNEVELLAEMEHARWVEERVGKGWIYVKNRDDMQKIHDCIVPWADLTEMQRQKDRNAIRALPAILAKVYLKIVRL
jgi:PAS domain S-box-containing protein